MFKDHFSTQPGSYSQYRPRYPAELFAYLAGLSGRREVALDCATGNGQAAVDLAEYFRRVVATDGSVAQLKQAWPHARVSYVANLAEEVALADDSVDLAVAAQAAHWFDFERYYTEMRRVLRPDGVIAVWTYARLHISPDVDAVIDHFYTQIVGPYWPPERRYIDEEYRKLPFPFAELLSPAFEIRVEWTFQELLGYLSTWSAVQRYRSARSADPIEPLRRELARYWNGNETPRPVVFPMYLKVGRP